MDLSLPVLDGWEAARRTKEPLSHQDDSGHSLDGSHDFR